MAKMRDDLFPNMAVIFEPKNKIIEMWVDEAFEAFRSLFSSKEKFIEYLNSFKDPRNAELLIGIGGFYLLAKKYHPQSYIRLIMIISIIEKLTNRERKFQEFYEWIESQDAKINELLTELKIIDVSMFKEITRKLKENYFQEFGSRRNVLAFFEEHFTQEDKIKLIKSLKSEYRETVRGFSERLLKNIFGEVKTIEELKGKGFNVQRHFVPYCYDWRRCYFDYGECFPDYGCLLNEDKPLLDKTLKKVVGKIYQMRSDFIHDATITMLNEKDAMCTFTTSGGKVISIELTVEDLQNMFEKALKHYFDSLIQGTG
jgi:hypothetical protein